MIITDNGKDRQMGKISSPSSLEKNCNGPWLDPKTNSFLIITSDYTWVRIENPYCSIETIPVPVQEKDLCQIQFCCRMENKAVQDRKFWKMMYNEYIRTTGNNATEID